MAWLEDLTDDIIRDILLRIPSDDVASLLRASVVCRRWRRIIAHPDFRRLHGELHRSPVLGFIHAVSHVEPYHSRFVPIDSDYRRPARRELPRWLVLDCRRGRALFVTQANDPRSRKRGILDFVVWDPLTNQHRLLPRPESPPLSCRRNFNAAVLCATDVELEGGDHLDCHWGNFHVAFVWSLPYDPSGRGDISFATMYSSETGTWSAQVSFRSDAFLDLRPCPSALAGAALYFRGATRRHAFEYKLGVQHQQKPLSVIEEPAPDVFNHQAIFLMSPQGGRLGFAGVEHGPQGGGMGFAGVEHGPDLFLCVCWREINPNGVAQWARGETIVLENLLLNVVPIQDPQPWILLPDAVVVGFAEGTDVIFVAVRLHVHYHIYMVELTSGSASRVLENSVSFVFPVTTFCVRGM
jgi:hypothetical protein